MKNEDQQLLYKALCSYLPYKLNIKISNTEKRLVTHRGFEDNPLEIITIGDACTGLNGKLVLRPLSDLTKPITHKRETFIPIVELCRLSCIYECKGNAEYIEDSETEICTSINNWCLTYNKIFNNFHAFHNVGFNACTENKANNLELFEKLREWHFNIDLPKEMFFDINTLEE